MGPGARRSAIQAVRVQRSDPANMVLAMVINGDEGGEQDASLLDEIVHTWPSIVVSPGWDRIALGTSPHDGVRGGIKHWRAGGTISVPDGSQELWLSALAGRSDLIGDATAASPLPPEIASALVSVIGCDKEATDLLASIRGRFLRDERFWFVATQWSAYGNADPLHAARILG